MADVPTDPTAQHAGGGSGTATAPTANASTPSIEQVVAAINGLYARFDKLEAESKPPHHNFSH